MIRARLRDLTIMMAAAADDGTTTVTNNSSSSSSSSNNNNSSDHNTNRMAVLSSSSTSSTTNKVNIGKQLQQRLVQLTDTSSRESLQTIARWMAFHRKHSKALSTTLMGCIKDQLQGSNTTTTLKRILLYLSIAQDVILMGSDMLEDTTTTSKDFWNKMKHFRVHLLQLVFVPTVTALCEDSLLLGTWKEKLDDMILQWEKYNMAQDELTSPTIHQIISILTDATVTKEEEPNNKTESTVVTTDIDNIRNVIKKDDEEEEKLPPLVEQTTPLSPTSIKTDPIVVPSEELKNEPSIDRSVSDGTVKVKKEEKPLVAPAEVSMATTPNKKPRVMEPSAAGSSNTSQEEDTSHAVISSSTSTGNNNLIPSVLSDSNIVAVDFETEGIPQERVDAEEILIPYRSIATSQIARELRHDAIERISTIVNSVNVPMKHDPEQQQQQQQQIEHEQQYTDEFLDLPLREALQTIEHYRNATQHQYAARRQCVELLLKSRCQFGSTEAAEEFFSLQNKIKLLQQHILLLQDAMELEGLDFETVKKEEDEATATTEINDMTMEQRLQSLDPISWYTSSHPV